MDRHGDYLLLSASDLVAHLNCGYLTGLDIAVANGSLAKPIVWDPLLELLWARGAQHEQGFVEHLRAQGFDITVIEGVGVQDDAIALTHDAMRRGEDLHQMGGAKLGSVVAVSLDERWIDIKKRMDKGRFPGLVVHRLRPPLRKKFIKFLTPF